MRLRGVKRGKVVHSAIGNAEAPCPLGKRLHVRLGPASLALRGVRHRRVRPSHRGLVGEQFNVFGFRAGRIVW